MNKFLSFEGGKEKKIREFTISLLTDFYNYDFARIYSTTTTTTTVFHPQRVIDQLTQIIMPERDARDAAEMLHRRRKKKCVGKSPHFLIQMMVLVKEKC